MFGWRWNWAPCESSGWRWPFRSAAVEVVLCCGRVLWVQEFSHLLGTGLWEYQLKGPGELGAEVLSPCDWSLQSRLSASVQCPGSNCIFFSLQCILLCLLKFIGETCPGCLHSFGSNYSNHQLTNLRQKPFVFIMKGKTNLIKIFS